MMDETERLWARAVRENLPGPEAQAALNELRDAIEDRGPTPCKGREAEYSDYNPKHPPPISWVARACDGCPVLNECFAYGVAAKRDFKRRDYALTGVYAGIKIETVRV